MKKDKNYFANFGYLQPLEPQPIPVTQDTRTFNQVPMPPAPTLDQTSTSTKSPSNMNKALGVGVQGLRTIGSALNSFMTGAPQLINAMLPDQPLEREDRDIRSAQVQYPQGTGSQAIYEEGGEIVARNGYNERKRRKGNIQVTEEVPVDINTFANNVKPQTFPVTPPQHNPQFIPLPEQQKKIQFEKLLDKQGNAQFSPIFSGNYTRHEAEQAMSQLPEYFGEIPVLRSPDLYKDVMQGFDQGSRGWDWKRTMFEDGGTLEERQAQKLPALEMSTIPEDTKRKSSYNALSFGEAFKAARKEMGSGNIFEWKGKKYTTNMAKEESVKPIAEVRATKIKDVSPKTQKVNSLQEHIYNSQAQKPSNNPVTPSMQQFNPAFRKDFDLNLPKEETVYGHNRPAPRGLQKLAQSQEFNTFVENAGVATVPLDMLGLMGLGKSAAKSVAKSVSKNARNLNQAATRNMAMQNVRNAENELAQYNLRGHKNTAAGPAQQWEKNPGNFEYQGQSPVQQYSNSYTIESGGTPMRQVMDIEDMLESPFQNAFPIKQPNNWSPLQNIDITPVRQPMTTNFKNGGYIEGQELDLSIEEIKRLQSMGYELEF
jgi:hypothetical protein